MPELLDRFVLEIEGLSAALRVAQVAGHEALSELFEFHVTLASEDPDLAPADVVGKAALLSLATDAADTPRHVHGLVARFEVGDQGKRLSYYHVTIVPKAHRLHHRHDCRIFQELTAPDIVKKVLEGAGFATGTDFRFALQASYTTREYCVQYRESDFAFVSRLLEEEGIHYFFEHTDGGHVMVFADKPAAHEPIAGTATIAFRPPLGAMSRGEHVNRFRFSAEVRPGKLTLRDYNFLKPSLKLESTKSGTTDTDLEIYDHPGGFMVGSDGTTIAERRLDERNALREVAEGEAAIARFTPGQTFTLSDHSREALNQEYLLVRVEHRGFEPTMMEATGAGEQRYENRFVAIPKAVPFRPPLVTPRPTIKGLQSAVVVGPSGDEIYTDEHGRVKVQFHWDRLGKKDDKSSCWVRVSQIVAGEGWGAMFLPRVGHEVLVDFLDGDPDRPVVVGRVYHGTNVPPYALPGEKTKSTIKTNTSTGGGGFNELRFEDKAGSEEVYVHAQKDLFSEVVNDRKRTVGHDETVTIENDRTLETKNDQKETIGNDETFEVGRDRTAKVARDETLSVGQDRKLTVERDLDESVKRNQTLQVAGTSTVEVKKDATATFDEKLSVTGKNTITLAADKDLTITVKGASSETVDLGKKITSNKEVVIECGACKVTLASSGEVKIDAVKISINAQSEATILAQGKTTVEAMAQLTVKAAGQVEVKGALVMVG